MADSKERRHSSAKRAESSHSIMKTAPIATLLMPISGLFVLFICALCTYNTSSPASFALPAAILSLCIGSASGGFFDMKRLTGSKGYIGAAISALLFVLLLILCRIFVPSSGTETNSAIAIITFAAIIAASQLGAFLGAQGNTRRRKRKRR